jgi:hypothetical protein
VAAFGVGTIVEKLKKKRESYIHFVQTHLTACVQEQNLPLFMELLQSLYSQTEPRFAISLHELDTIIHYQTSGEDSAFFKTALFRAVEKSDRFMVLELLKLEHEYHKTEKEALICMNKNFLGVKWRDLPGLKPWIIGTYTKINKLTLLGTFLGKVFLLSFFSSWSSPSYQR